MLRLSDEEKKTVEEFAALLLKPEEVALICQLNPEQAEIDMIDKEGDFYLAYMRGFYLTKAKIRKSVVEMAQRDSSPAHNLSHKLISQIENTYD